MTPISATIITLNEEARIRETIDALDFCDEILVVDSGSGDRTLEIASESGARVCSRPWTGYADQKNFAAAQATHDWILSIDADERPGDALREEILAWKRSGGCGAGAAWSMPRLTRYLGRWIYHSGWYPDRKVRLYDRRHSRWRGDFVHESVETDRDVHRFEGDLLHFPFTSLEDHYRRMERYSQLAAREAESRGKRFSRLRLLALPAVTFLAAYVIRRGFLDGRHGLRIAYMGARYVSLREARISR